MDHSSVHTHSHLRKHKILFQKININNCQQIFRYLDYFSLVEVYFVNKRFKSLASIHYKKRIDMIITSFKIYKKHIKIKFNQDIRLILKNNSMYIRKEIKPMIMNILSDYYYKLPVMKFYFNKINKVRISKIDLSAIDISKRSIKYLCYYIENNLTLRKINLSNNIFNSSALSPLKNYIQSVKNLKILKLDNCSLDIQSLGNLDSALKINLGISSLSMRKCNLDDNMITQITSSHLKCLNLSENNISTDGVIHITKHFKYIEKLNLSKNNLNTSSVIPLAIYLKRSDCLLTNLNLEENYISSSGFYILLQHDSSRLKKLNLNNNILTDFKNAQFVGIENLKIASNKFNYEDYSLLFNNLIKSESLKKLDLSNNKFTDQMIVLIFEILSKNNRIEQLSLKSCYLGKSHFIEILITFLLNNNCNIKKLNLANNYLSNSKQLGILISTNKLISLNLSGNDFNLNDKTISTFNNFLNFNKSLKILNLSNNFLCDKVLPFLKNLSNLEKLILDKNNLSNFEVFNKICESIYDNKMLLELSLNSNDLEDNFLSPIVELLKRNNKLNLINLKNNKFTVLGLVILSKSFQNDENEFINRNCIIKLKSKSLQNSLDLEKNCDNINNLWNITY